MFFEGKLEDRDHMMQFFDDHLRAVKEFVPAGRLLVYSVREGWDPLCSFLEVDAPRQPFPHANIRGSLKEVVKKLLTGAG